jgi:hypothetical protein
MAIPVYAESSTADWPSGKYRLIATLERGGAAAGAAAEFTVTDPAEMPKVEGEITLWGDDPQLAAWLGEHGIRTRPFDPARTGQETILIGERPPAGGEQAFAQLAARVSGGATAIFLSPALFSGRSAPLPAPLPHTARLASLASGIYHKDEWAKRHPIFAGLPSGLMDYGIYRELIGSLCWTGLDASAEAIAGAIHAAPAYESGLMVAETRSGSGRVILNTLRIRESLGATPVAERLLRNMLIYAGR